MIQALPHVMAALRGSPVPYLGSPTMVFPNQHLGSIRTGGNVLRGTGVFAGGLQQVIDTVSRVGGPFALLGMLWGGAVHTHVFHNERAPEHGKQILKMSGFGLFLMVFAPLLIDAVEHL